MIKLSLRKVAAVAASAAVSVLLSGCGALSSTLNSTISTGVGVETMSGKALGGLQPISGATISLFSMGTTGYGSSGALYATTTTDATGTWSFTRDTVDAAPNTIHANSGAVYSCASGAEQQMFVIATGGNTTGNGSTTSPNNPAATLIAVLGACHDLGAGTRVTLNEVVTAGSVIAMQQFFNAGTTPGTERFGRPSSGTASIEANYQSGLTNAVAMVGALTDVARGHAIQAIVPGSAVPGVTVAGTPEYQKLNSIANILAACVNSSYTTASTTNDTPSASCSLLFSNATPPASFSNTSQPTFTFTGNPRDIAQAVYFMSVNPSGSQTPAKFINLYSLQGGTPPFSPSLAQTTGQPNDWTVGIVYIASGNCSVGGSNGTLGAGTTTQGFLNNPFEMAIDKNGNIWVVNSGGSGSKTNFALYGPNGSPSLCINNGSILGRTPTIDTRGNVWFATQDGAVEYITDTANASVGQIFNWGGTAFIGGSTVANPTNPTNFKEMGTIVADGSGNIFIAPATTTTTTVNAYEFAGAATATTVGAITQVPGTIGTTVSPGYRFSAATASGNIFFSGSVANNIYVYKPSASAASSAYPGSANVTTPYGLATDLGGNVIGGNNSGTLTGKIYRINNDGTFGSVSGAYPGGANGNRGVAVDGAGNIWIGGVITATTDTAFTTTYLGLFETDANFNAISPTGSTPGTCTSTNCRTGGGFEKSFFNTAGIWSPQIDASGNVWGASNNATTGNLFVVVGTAVPRITPLVNDLH